MAPSMGLNKKLIHSLLLFTKTLSMDNKTPGLGRVTDLFIIGITTPLGLQKLSHQVQALNDIVTVMRLHLYRLSPV